MTKKKLPSQLFFEVYIYNDDSSADLLSDTAACPLLRPVIWFLFSVSTWKAFHLELSNKFWPNKTLPSHLVFEVYIYNGDSSADLLSDTAACPVLRTVIWFLFYGHCKPIYNLLNGLSQWEFLLPESIISLHRLHDMGKLLTLRGGVNQCRLVFTYL